MSDKWDGVERRQNKMLQPWQEMVVAEKAELDARIVLLRLFFASPEWAKTDSNERARLMRQEAHMLDYSEVLGERIMVF
jgi:uncharacterized protein